MGNNNRKPATPPKQRKEEISNVIRINGITRLTPKPSSSLNIDVPNNKKQELPKIGGLPLFPTTSDRTKTTVRVTPKPSSSFNIDVPNNKKQELPKIGGLPLFPAMSDRTKTTVPSINEIINSSNNHSRAIKLGESSNNIGVISQSNVLTMNSQAKGVDVTIDNLIKSMDDCNIKIQQLVDDCRMTSQETVPDSLTNDEAFKKQIEQYFESISDVEDNEEEDTEESSSESGEVELVKKKVSKLDSNVNDVYNPNELQNINEFWHKKNLRESSFWWKVVRLSDPVLIVLKILHCYQDRDKIEVLLVISSWDALIPMSIALKYASRCKLTYHKSRIAYDMLQKCNIYKIISLISLHAQISKDGIPIVRNLIEFYEDIILYMDNCLFYADMRSLMELLEVLQRFCLKNNDSLRKVNFMMDKLKSGNCNSYASFYPLNVLESSLNVRIPNKAYSNIFHYIDTNLALLKEDFESSVRSGIECCLTGKKTETEKSLTFYQNVTISKSRKKAPEFSYIIRFSQKDIKNFKTDRDNGSSIFFYGSLIFLSTDGFKTYLVAKVEDGTHIKDDNCFIAISFPVVPTELDLVAKYTMAEADQYFDPYCSAMKVLKNMPKYGFPFQRYIIHTERNVYKPNYLKPGSIYDIFGHKVCVSDRNSYPSPEKLKLNSNQVDALFKALNNELCLVQGPPGTGKTFMCRKIIQVLLANKGYWTNNHNTPIVVICYKNLSLDDLLTGLLKDNINVLRIGNRTSSEELSLFYSLGGMDPPKNAGTVTWSFARIRFLMNFNNQEMQKCLDTMLAVQKKDGVVKLGCLKGLMKTNDVKYLKPRFLLWLFGLEKYDLKSFSYIKGDANLIRKEHIRKFISSRKRLREKADNVCKERDCDADSSDFEDITTDLYTNEIFVANEILSKYKRFLNFNYEKVSEQEKQNVFNMSVQDVNNLESRWTLYYKWVEMSKTFLNYKINDLTRKQAELKGRLHETFNLFDARKIAQSNTDVIGITTTAATRLNILLDEIKPRIVIFEEAAEVIEGFCVASISKHCEHVILLGDHKQLRPLTISNQLAKEYNMSISLFERLANNGIEPAVLNRQYRMRPEISALICPSIYNQLDNDESVYKFDNVRGVANNVFFFNHNNYETRATENKSIFNIFEAKFCIYLAHYLINQGYSPDEITIIAAYGEQEKVLNSERQKFLERNAFDRKVQITHEFLREVTIATADSYQGKENNIIILSLVRNNKDGDIGFLKTNNRVCVALSRARMGLFVIGNMNMLKASSKLWNEINDILVPRNDIGDKLVCICQKHKRENKFESYEGLNSLKYGGCGAICKTKLECGHNCRYECHGWDNEHKLEFSCQLCSKPTENSRLYSDYNKVLIPPTENTHQDENNNCGFRYKCGHVCNFKCSMFGKGGHQTKLLCTSKCGMILNCKHVCTLNCHAGKKLFHAGKFACQVICDKLLPCGHKCTFNCHITKDVFHKSRFSCVLPCQKVLDCGHLCDYDCHSLSDPRHVDEYSCKHCKAD